jgi:hypothetical protein
MPLVMVTSGRAEKLKRAWVMFTDHNGPKPDTWSGMRDGILFFAGSEDAHQLRFPSPDGEPRTAIAQ